MANCDTNGHTCDKMFQEVKIPVPWGHIAGKWWGPTDKQPVLAIHGWQDNAGTFDNLAPLLCAEDIAILCIDLPGHGFSSPYPVGMYYYIFWDCLQIVRRIQTHYGWSRLKMLGHSLGGIVAYMYAAAYPTEVASIGCIDIASPAVRDPVKLVAEIGPTVAKFLKYENYPKELQPSYDYNEMVETALVGYGGSCTRDAVEVMLRRGMRKIGDDKYVFTRDLRLKAVGLAMIGLDESLAMAGRITCRVLNIRANPGMKQTNPENYDKVLDELEKTAAVLERHVVEGTHHLHLVDANSIAQIVISFLQDGK